MYSLQEMVFDFDGNLQDLCYEILVTNKDKKGAFEYACKNLLERPRDGHIKIKKHFTDEEFIEYDSIYEKLVVGIMNSVINMCNYGEIGAESFYDKLWEMYCKVLPTLKSRAYAFYRTIRSKSIPYRYLGKPVSMTNDRFRRITQDNKDLIDSIDYIASMEYEQRTTRASLVLNLLENVEGIEAKSVILSHAISALGRKEKEGNPNEVASGLEYEQIRRKEAKKGQSVSGGIDIDELIQRIDKKIEELEAEEAEEKEKRSIGEKRKKR